MSRTCIGCAKVVSLLIAVFSLSTPVALAAPGPDLLAGGHWTYSTDGGTSWSDTPPTLPTVTDMLVKISFTAPKLPEGTESLLLIENLKPGDGYWVTPYVNGNLMRGLLGDMIYRQLNVEPAELPPGPASVMFRIQLWNLEYRWKKLEPAPLNMTAELRPVPQTDLAIQAVPVVGATDCDSFAVTCRTNLSAAVTLEVKDESTGKPAGQRLMPSHGYFHRFRVHGLSPQTRYTYVLRARMDNTPVAVATEPRTVCTLADPASAAAKSLRFVAVGDSRTRPEEWRKVAAAVARSKPQLVVFGGDMVALGTDEALWDSDFIDPAAGLLSTVPFYPVQGNHEDNCSLYRELFYTASEDGRNTNWTQSFGNVLMIGIDGGQDWSAGSENVKWLEQMLASATEDFIFVATHYPAYTSAGHGKLNEAGMPAERPVLQAQTVILPLMEKYHATAMLAGHDHIYERTEPPGGVPVIITGGAGAPPAKKLETAAKQNPYSKVFVDSLHYCVFEVNGDTCVMRAITPEGKEIDTRTWKARSAKPALAPAARAISHRSSVDVLASCR